MLAAVAGWGRVSLAAARPASRFGLASLPRVGTVDLEQLRRFAVAAVEDAAVLAQ